MVYNLIEQLNKAARSKQKETGGHRWEAAGRIVQLQNLPRNILKDIDLARGIVKDNDFDLLEMLYGTPMEVLSQLIRTAFIAEDNKTFIVRLLTSKSNHG